METEVEVSRFQLTAPSSTSMREKLHFDDPRFHLHIVQKKETRSKRPIIESLKKERLAYYRSFTSTTSKSDVIPVQHADVNSFLWFYTLNVFFKTIPHSFVHFFLAAYAPDEHMFVTKMVPISHGLKYLFVIAGFLDLTICTDMMVLLLHYTMSGILLKNPWNRCPDPNVYLDEFRNVTIHCYEIPEFVKLFVNKSYNVHEFSFIVDENHHFQVSQIEYYRIHAYYAAYIRDFALFMVLWVSMTVFHQFALKKYFWKVIYWSQFCIIAVDIVTFMYLVLTLYDKEEPPISVIPNLETAHTSHLWSTDLELLAESITAPPIVHVLTSRSTQDINPAADSATMVISNAIIYIFKGLHSLRLKAHCEALLRTEIPVTQFNQHQWLYFFPIFWSQFYLGDIFSNIYFVMNFVLEYLVIFLVGRYFRHVILVRNSNRTCRVKQWFLPFFHSVITYCCVVESVIYEWPKLKRWMVMAVFFACGVLMFIFTSVDQRVVLWAYGKGIATLMETIFLYVFYPVGRLVDDYTFHYGHAPTQLRVLSMRLVPVYYTFKFYVLVDSLWAEMKVNELGKYVTHYTWSWSLMVLPILIGFGYIFYKYLVIYRTTWNYIFRPKPKWGPQDFSERQLRKNFDSRYFIGSEAPKLLTRYLNSKRESKVYKIDVQYDFYRRSTPSPMAVRFGKQKDTD